LVENCGRLVTKSELVSAIWPDTSVGDPNLASVISVVRKTLGDSGDSQRYIKTVAKSGYRFVGAVRPGSSGPRRKEDHGKSPVPPAILPASVSADSPSSRKTTVLFVLLVFAMIGGCLLDLLTVFQDSGLR
jgi:DNA-binding winged helix-turn-helix (wHTH) protein